MTINPHRDVGVVELAGQQPSHEEEAHQRVYRAGLPDSEKQSGIAPCLDA